MNNSLIDIRIPLKTSVLSIELTNCILRNQTIVKFSIYKDDQWFVNNQSALSYKKISMNDDLLQVFKHIYIKNKDIKSLKIIHSEKLLYKQKIKIDDIKVVSWSKNNYKLIFYKNDDPVLISYVTGFQVSNILQQIYELNKLSC